MNKQTNLIWIDLEMTGLNPHTDVILEIATIITDDQLNVIHTGPELIINQSDSVLSSMNDFVTKMHTSSGLINKVKASNVTLQQAEEQTLKTIRQYCLQGKGVLCGNSVWQDRNFLAHYMPRIVDHLHYRLIDVTAVKEVVRRWYPDHPHADFKKQDAHRALGDIKESIDELQHFRKYFFV
jgi:oligoribonuclease